MMSTIIFDDNASAHFAAFKFNVLCSLKKRSG